MAPDELCSELLGQDLSSVSCLWRRTLFLHGTQENMDISMLQEKIHGQRATGAQNKHLFQLSSKLLVD